MWHLGLVLIFILYSQDQKEVLAQIHPQVHGWANSIFISMWPAKNQSRRLPMPDYVISDNPCQARLPTALSRGRTARLSPTSQSSSSRWLHVNALGCQGRNKIHSQKDCRRCHSDGHLSGTGGRHCDRGSWLLMEKKNKSHATVQSKHLSQCPLKWTELNRIWLFS